MLVEPTADALRLRPVTPPANKCLVRVAVPTKAAEQKPKSTHTNADGSYCESSVQLHLLHYALLLRDQALIPFLLEGSESVQFLGVLCREVLNKPGMKVDHQFFVLAHDVQQSDARRVVLNVLESGGVPIAPFQQWRGFDVYFGVLLRFKVGFVDSLRHAIVKHVVPEILHESGHGRVLERLLSFLLIAVFVLRGDYGRTHGDTGVFHRSEESRV